MTDAMVFYSAVDTPETWRAALTAAVPGLTFVLADEPFDPELVRYALVWSPPRGFFNRFPNLRLIVNLGAGVDALVARDDLPPGVAITRLHDPLMARMMASYVLFAVLRLARDIPAFEAAQRQGRWAFIEPRPLDLTRVGVMGLGELGLRAAKECARQGFQVRGWSRSPKADPDIVCYSGMDSLAEFLSGCDILVCLLPKTPQTIGLLNAERLALLPHGAGFVNVARGAIVDQAALVEALRARRIGQAVLDVFQQEPLPEGDPLWGLDNVLITPHVASVALPASAAPQIADNIHRIRDGQPVLDAVNLSRGY
ncbi:D-3-phosphoglycerate dehydrogenase [Gluconacetobacter johannae DSM 13595]|uniref:Glyoxylate/hydroxypyruvate reductase A n=1 Tax=Gluconacetobacter johannae TaxID=112140 RepID=A0A7W4JAH1_9PROT|nr:glyoxylate/hydroxypyruvate reductase A [Gluconacetobacter johannae]MBB2177514.1 glyoxylate/hydroxypyruvate reductase A [Gluconacetobacter johannae]GBQ88222.1 D-3-phosphoglycerate dehydrogenase [Gluconacetobacter johannae DSM 13595]